MRTRRACSVIAIVALCASGCGDASSPTAPNTPPAPATVNLATLSLADSSATAGETVEGTVTLSGAAPASGTTVTLSSDSASATVPASVVVPSGTTSAAFSVAIAGVNADTEVTITAAAGGVSRTVGLRVTASGGPIASITSRHDDIIGGDKTTGTVTLADPAPAGGMRMSLSSDDADVSVPSSLTIAAGGTTGTFEIATEPVSSAKTVRVTIGVASVAAGRRTAAADGSVVLTLTLLPEPATPPSAPTLTGISPASGVQGTNVAVTLTGSNFVAGASVEVSGSGVTVNSISVGSGTSVTATFAIAAGAATDARDVTVTTTGGTTGGQTFTVNAPEPEAPTLTGANPDSGVQGTSVDVALTGTNFIAGADIEVSGTGVTVSGISIDSATTITATFVIAAGAAPGARTVTVTTASGTSGTQPFTVGAGNAAPVADDGSYTTDEDTALNVAAPGVLDGDTDANGDTLTAALVTDVSDGALTLNANGSFIYTPDANFNGSDSFTYRANDGPANSNTATVTITVNAVNDAPPVADDDSYTTDEDTVLNVAAPGVLDGDTDADDDALTASLVSGPSNGALSLNASGSFTYTPSANFNGTDSFTYRASDGVANSGLATVTITVTSVLDEQTFDYNGTNGTDGSVQNFVVPAGVTSITITATGAQGGAGDNTPGNLAGLGGTVVATITVTANETLAIFVGGAGGQGITGPFLGGTGGFNGGATGDIAGDGGGGGGGASDLRRAGVALADRIVVAGGGGGGGGGGGWNPDAGAGGVGGGLIGGAGGTSSGGAIGGGGGGQDSGGIGGDGGTNGGPGGNAALGLGGGGGDAAGDGGGGAGGGGYYGGGGGEGSNIPGTPDAGGGGGGSSFTTPGATNVTHQQGVRTGHGVVIIRW